MSSPEAEDRPGAMPSGFSCDVRHEAGIGYVVIGGELDLASVGELERQMRDLRVSGCASLIVDLRRLTFIDLRGVRLIETWAELAERELFSFEIVAGPPSVKRTFALASRLRTQAGQRAPTIRTRAPGPEPVSLRGVQPGRQSVRNGDLA